MSYRNIFGCVIILFLFPASCATFKDYRTIKAVHDSTILKCYELNETSRQLCIDIINDRNSMYKKYAKGNKEGFEKIEKEIIALIKDANTLRKKINDPNDKYYVEYKSKLNKIDTLSKKMEKEYIEYNKNSVSILNSASTIPQVSKNAETDTRTICTVRDNGRIQCLRLGSILAIYNEKTSKIILKDIVKLHNYYVLDKKKDLLFECTPGEWGNVESSEDTEDSLSKIKKLCDDVALSQDSKSSGTQVGFSGISGFDPFDIEMCGKGLFENPINNVTLIIEQAMNMAETFHEECDDSVFGSAMEGGEEQPDVETGDDDEENGDELEVVSEEVKKEDNGDGTSTVTTVTTYEDGTKRTRIDIVDNETGDVKYGIVNIQKSDGGNSSRLYINNKDKSSSVWVTGKTAGGKFYSVRYERDKDGNVSNWRSGKSLNQCVDESCSNCINFSELFFDSISDCMQTAGNSARCLNYLKKASCCSEENGYSPKASLIIPNPDGDYICGGEPDIETQKANCNRVCMVAYHENCLENCMSNRDAGYNFTFADLFCRYAMSEACVSSGEIEYPFKEERKPGIPPIPTIGGGQDILFPHNFFNTK